MGRPFKSKKQKAFPVMLIWQPLIMMRTIKSQFLLPPAHAVLMLVSDCLRSVSCFPYTLSQSLLLLTHFSVCLLPSVFYVPLAETWRIWGEVKRQHKGSSHVRDDSWAESAHCIDVHLGCANAIVLIMTKREDGRKKRRLRDAEAAAATWDNLALS